MAITKTQLLNLLGRVSDHIGCETCSGVLVCRWCDSLREEVEATRRQITRDGVFNDPQ